MERVNIFEALNVANGGEPGNDDTPIHGFEDDDADYELLPSGKKY